MDRERIPGEREPKAAGAEELAMLERLRPYVRQSGDEIRGPWFMKERILLDYLLVGIGSGNGVFSVGGKSFAVGKWDLIWIPPWTKHQMRGSSPSMRCSYIHFDLLHKPGLGRWDACIPGGALDLERFRQQGQERPTGTLADAWEGKLEVSNAPEAMALLKAICAERVREAQGFNLAAAGMLLQLLALLLRGSGEREGKAKARTRAAAESLEEGACLCGRSVEALAERSHLSPSRFRRLYREAHGQSPREATLKARMRLACELLVYSDLNVSEVAERLGYANPHNFTRAFTRELGLPPGEYKTGR
jgi:AraC-like DNA-binding protein